MNKIFAVLFGICSAISYGYSFASTLALTPHATGGGYGNPAGYDWGYAFQVTTPISVSALAYYEDSDPAPLQSTHTVGIWIDGQPSTPLATATVHPGSSIITISGSPNHYFYYTSITPVVLNTGTTYVVAGSPGSGDTMYVTPAFTSGAEIAYIEGRYGYGQGGYAGSAYSYAAFGGNFLYEPASAPVPLPASLWLFVSGLVALTLRRRARISG